MRLICPNCGAQYEVGDDVIPKTGRDVQCSNCAHTWYESPGASEADEDDEIAVPASPTPPEPMQEPEPEPAQTVPEPLPEPAPAAAPARQARAMDPEVTDILRQEAQYERAARQAEAAPLETQTDLDLSHDPEPQGVRSFEQHVDEEDETPADPEDDDPRKREARDRLARLRGEPDPTVAAVGAIIGQSANAPRRELLPDIEEINSTLRPDARPAADEDDEAPAKDAGFRRGFVSVVLIACIALAVYVFAPQISAAVPATEGALSGYVDWVDGMRLWLDARVQGWVAVDPLD